MHQKSTATLFTTDPSELHKPLSLKINNITIPTVEHPKILGITFDPKLNYGEHIKKTKEKASKTINILKAITSAKWGKHKETLVTTYKIKSNQVYFSTTVTSIHCNTHNYRILLYINIYI